MPASRSEAVEIVMQFTNTKIPKYKKDPMRKKFVIRGANGMV
jgi:hypothetical protein